MERFNPTLRELIEELKQFPEDMMDEEVISIGTYSGNNPYRYTVRTINRVMDLGKTTQKGE